MSTIEQIPQLPVPEERHWKRYLIDSLIAVAGVAAVTLIIYAYHLYPTIPNISLIYLLLILLLASTRGRYASIVAAVVAVLAFDFFLVPPLYTFVISRWEEWIALFVFLVAALITSQLTTQSRESVEQARLREREARILYEAGRVINITDNLDEQLDSIVLAFVRVFSPWGVRECALLLPDKDGTLAVRADAPIRVESFTLTPNEMVVAREAFAEGRIREISTPTQYAATETITVLRLVPLKAENEILGLLCMRIEHGVSWFASSQRMQEELEQPTDQAIFFWTFLDQIVRVIEEAQLRSRSLSNNE
jgi:two-component system sensor histidine kinase KdpD